MSTFSQTTRSTCTRTSAARVATSTSPGRARMPRCSRYASARPSRSRVTERRPASDPGDVDALVLVPRGDRADPARPTRRREPRPLPVQLVEEGAPDIDESGGPPIEGGDDLLL